MRMRNAFGIGHDAQLPQTGKLYLDGLAADTPLDAVLVAERAGQALQLLEDAIAGFDSVGLVVLADADDASHVALQRAAGYIAPLGGDPAQVTGRSEERRAREEGRAGG